MKPWLTALSLSGMGFYIAGSIVLGIVGGRWLDEKLGTAPLFFIIGLIIGLAVAGYGTYNMIKPFLQNTDNNKKSKES
jgi:F0F1-type ATP synthase assembly protein I